MQLQLWRRDVPLEAARVARDAARRLPTDEPRGLLIVVEHGARPPEGEARQILTELGTKLSGAVGCAFVSEGEGFMAATMRGVMTSMALLVRPSFPVKVFSDVRDAASWLAERTGRSPSELVSALGEMRDRRA
ncbi:MAG: hypothetical protein KF901_19295 [Myxococcales bacterium]|nr:hypothetical protein [Myxococcales bacterium]